MIFEVKLLRDDGTVVIFHRFNARFAMEHTLEHPVIENGLVLNSFKVEADISEVPR